MSLKKHVHDLVTWGGQPHQHPGPRKGMPPRGCSEMHGYCTDPTCHAVLQPGDNRQLPDKL